VGPPHRHVKYGTGYPELPHWHEIPFFKGQKKIVLRNCGLINPDDIEEYIAVGGYQALYKVLIDANPEAVIEQIKAAKLRGRGGAGYLTGNKWELLRKAQADEVHHLQRGRGRPRRLHEPQRDRERPALAARGHAHRRLRDRRGEGIVYVRAEYPLAVHRLEHAIEQAREYGLLGDNILGRGFNFDIELVEGAGRLRVRRGDRADRLAGGPRRPAAPAPAVPRAERGLWGKPTNINNVETWYNVAPSSPRAAPGSPRRQPRRARAPRSSRWSARCKNTGLVEMPLGTPLRSSSTTSAAGGTNGKRIKAMQTGGPSGGCIPQEMFDTPVDYETLAPARLDHGLGRHGGDGRRQLHGGRGPLLHRVHPLGVVRQVRPLPRGLGPGAAHAEPLTEGEATLADLDTLDELCRMIRDTSLCGLGQTRPTRCSPRCGTSGTSSRTTSARKRCRAGVCEDLALSPCENSCPLHMNIPRFLQLYKEGRLEDAFLNRS
jgi:NADH-quinone oxidoreductase subunit F